SPWFPVREVGPGNPILSDSTGEPPPSTFNYAWDIARRVLRVVKTAIICGVSLACVFNVLERLYLINGSYYPRILGVDVGAIDYQALGTLRRDRCPDEPLEVYQKQAGTVVIRCGTQWLFGHTFISSVNPFRDVASQ
ncbi:hypothetical protein, partial [Staphylococcus sp. EG-SA-21]|uniref:hypothetical protein n=1 Tax=Staphylococcus sp. EG-SA-21 TaxID=2767496 RepID=UPI001981F82F